jgi:hypothetical protein
MTKRQLILVRLAMIPVVAAAAWNSYWHTVHVALAYGQDTTSAYMLPLSIDGLMFAASLVFSHAVTTRTKVVSTITLVIGFGASFAANMLATDGGLIAHIVSGWYALSLLLGVELFQSTNKRAMKKRPAPRKRTAPATKAVAAKKAPVTRRIPKTARASLAPVTP